MTRKGAANVFFWTGLLGLLAMVPFKSIMPHFWQTMSILFAVNLIGGIVHFTFIKAEERKKKQSGD